MLKKIYFLKVNSLKFTEGGKDLWKMKNLFVTSISRFKMLFIHSGVDVALNGQILKRLLDGPAAQAVNLGLELMYTFAFPLRTFMDQMQNILVDEVKVVVLAILLYLIYF